MLSEANQRFVQHCSFVVTAEAVLQSLLCSASLCSSVNVVSRQQVSEKMFPIHL